MNISLLLLKTEAAFSRKAMHQLSILMRHPRRYTRGMLAGSPHRQNTHAVDPFRFIVGIELRPPADCPHLRVREHAFWRYCACVHQSDRKTSRRSDRVSTCRVGIELQSCVKRYFLFPFKTAFSKFCLTLYFTMSRIKLSGIGLFSGNRTVPFAPSYAASSFSNFFMPADPG